jgi:hypothetical protein
VLLVTEAHAVCAEENTYHPAVALHAKCGAGGANAAAASSSASAALDAACGAGGAVTPAASASFSRMRDAGRDADDAGALTAVSSSSAAPDTARGVARTSSAAPSERIDAGGALQAIFPQAIAGQSVSVVSRMLSGDRPHSCSGDAMQANGVAAPNPGMLSADHNVNVQPGPHQCGDEHVRHVYIRSGHRHTCEMKVVTVAHCIADADGTRSYSSAPGAISAREVPRCDSNDKRSPFPLLDSTGADSDADADSDVSNRGTIRSHPEEAAQAPPADDYEGNGSGDMSNMQTWSRPERGGSGWAGIAGSCPDTLMTSTAQTAKQTGVLVVKGMSKTKNVQWEDACGGKVCPVIRCILSFGPQLWNTQPAVCGTDHPTLFNPRALA